MTAFFAVLVFFAFKRSICLSVVGRFFVFPKQNKERMFHIHERIS